MRPSGSVARALALVVALAGLLGSDATAHSGLRFSSPLDGSTLGASPTHVRLTFVEKPEIALSTIRVADTSGGAYHAGRPEAVPGDPLSLSVPLRPLGRGVYTVHWRVLSAVDGHVSSGVFVFGVLVTPQGAVSNTASSSVSSVEVLARTAFLTGLVLVLGAAAAQIGRFGSARALAAGVFGWLLSLAGLATLIGAQARVAGVGVVDLSSTAIGRSLVWRIVALAATGLALIAWNLGRRTARPSRVRLGAVGVAIGAVAAVSVHAAAGHAAAGRWDVASTVAAQVTHFAFAGIWLGGLAVLIAGLKGAASDRDGSVRRFSNLAAVGLVIVAVSGLVRTLQEVSSWADLGATGYGRIVLAKIALLFLITGLGALNRWRGVPQAAADLRPLRRTAAIELVFAALAVIAAGLLGALAPPAAVQAMAGIDVSGVDFATTVRARLTAASDQPGPNRFVVSLRDYDSGDAVAADRVSLRFTPLDDPGVSSTTLLLGEGPDQDYVGAGANLSFDGRWRVQVLIERGGTSVEVPLEVETRGLPQFRSVLRPTGQAPSYTAEVRGVGFVRVTVDPEQAGPTRLHITFFNEIYEVLAVDDITVTMGATLVRHVTVNRQDRNVFAGRAELSAGRNDISVTARSADGARLRSTFTIDVPPR